MSRFDSKFCRRTNSSKPTKRSRGYRSFSKCSTPARFRSSTKRAPQSKPRLPGSPSITQALNSRRHLKSKMASQDYHSSSRNYFRSSPRLASSSRSRLVRLNTYRGDTNRLKAIEASSQAIRWKARITPSPQAFFMRPLTERRVLWTEQSGEQRNEDPIQAL